jgi:ABC-type transporter MlaC component
MMFTCSVFAQVTVPADVFVKAVADDVLTIVKKDKDIQNGDQAKIFALAEEKIVPNFNFDHVCAPICKLSDCGWPRTNARQIQHCEPAEG